MGDRAIIEGLSNRPFEKLSWNGSFIYPDMYRIRTIGDGSCFFHAIASAYFKPYIEGVNGGKAFDRRSFVRKLRQELADKLGQRINPVDPNSPTYYQQLSRGKLEEMSKDLDKYSLKYMQNELRASVSVDNMYNEFISNVLDKDIYILDLSKKDVYITGSDDDLLYKGRDSIVIGAMPGHYELIGIMVEGRIKTLFPHSHPFIEAIRTRMIEARSNPRP